MLLKTRHFGEIVVDNNKVIRFSDGLPGFNHVKQFVILESELNEEQNSGFDIESGEDLDTELSEKLNTELKSNLFEESDVKLNARLDTKSDGALVQEPDATETESPFKWLQCVDDPMLAFAIANPFLLKPDYDVELSDEVIEHLEIKKETDVAIYAVVVVPEDVTKMTMNLKAPLVINIRNRKGVQAILDTEEYSIRHYVMEDIDGQEVKANACADKKKGSVHCNRR